MGNNLASYDSVILALLGGGDGGFLVFPFGIRSWPVGLLALLYFGFRRGVTHFFWSWMLASVLNINSHLIMASSSYSHCKDFFGLLSLSLVWTLLRLLGNFWLLHPYLSRMLKILGGWSQAYPSRHSLRPPLLQVSLCMGDIFTSSWIIFLIARQWSFCSGISSLFFFFFN